MSDRHEKRGRPFNHYGGDRGQPQNKRHKGNAFNDREDGYSSQHRGNNHHSGHGDGPQFGKQNGFQNTFQRRKANPVLEAIERLPDPANCKPCKMRAEEMQTGLVSLLDHFVQEEMGPEGDRHVIHHARELHRLLSARGNKPSEAKQKLDESVSGKETHVVVPSYIAENVERSSNLPPLPPITEPHLQEATFTHRSMNKPMERGARGDLFNYEKLEFLGDAYLEVIASRVIYSHFPHLESGQQSAFRETLVKNATLVKFAEDYGLGDRIAHSSHMDKDKHGWMKIVADVFEAYVAAVVLSDPVHGFETAEKWLTDLWAPQLLEHKDQIVQNPRAKEQLEKDIAFKGVKIQYKQERPMENIQGVQRYYIGVYLTGWGCEDKWLGSGKGQNQALAGQDAARDALNRSAELIAQCAAKKQEAVGIRNKEREERLKADLASQKNDDNEEVDAQDGLTNPDKQSISDCEREDAVAALAKPTKRQRDETEVGGTNDMSEKKKKKSKKDKKEKTVDAATS